MSFLQRLKSWIGIGGGSYALPPAEANALQVTQAHRREPPRRGDRQLLELVMATPEFTRVAVRVAEAFSSINFYAVSEGDATRSGLAAILKNPNSDLSGRATRYLEQLWLDTLGESFALVSVLDGELTYLPIPPTWVQLDPAAERPYIVSLESQQYRFGADEMVWYKRPDPGNPFGRGLGLGRAAADEIETIEYAGKHAKSFFYNDGVPPLVFMAKGAADSQLERARQSYEDKHRGFRRAYRPAFLGSEWSVLKLGADAPAAGVTELRRHLADVVRTLYGVPPEIIGQIENSNRATIGAARMIFGEHCLEPRAAYYADEVNSKLVPLLKRLGRGGALLGYVSPIPDDVDGRRELMRDRPECFTINEVRAEAGLPARVDGDAYIRNPTQQVAVNAGQLEEEETRSAPTPPPLPARRGADDGERVVLRLVPEVSQRSAQQLELLLAELKPDVLVERITPEAQSTLEGWVAREAASLELEVPAQLLNPYTLEYARQLDEQILPGLHATTVAAVRRELVEGLAAGEGSAAIARRLRQMPEFSRERAALIGRTEASRAANSARQRVYEISPAVEFKEWVAAGGPRTRAKHSGLSGQVVAVEALFTAGDGTQVAHPGAWPSVGDQVNCRCTIVAADSPERSAPAERAMRLREFTDQIEADEARVEAAAFGALRAQLAAVLRRLEDVVRSAA